MINHYDWKIHRKLEETRRVYICPARHNDKTYTQLKLYAELMTQNKNIKVIRASDVRDVITKLKTEPVLDYDLEFELNRSHRYQLFGDWLHKNYRDYFFKPRARPGVMIPYAYPFDDSDIMEDRDQWLKKVYFGTEDFIEY